jgi:hypothetical protein
MTYDPDTGNTGDLTDTQSYSWIIVDWIFSELKSDPFFANFAMMRINRALPVDAWAQVPFLGIYLGDERRSADGDANAGNIRFLHNVPISFQIILRNNDPQLMLRDLDRTSWFIERKLWRSNDFTNSFNTKLPGRTAFEGIIAGRIRDRWGLTGSKNETPVGERQMDFTFMFGTNWSPYGFPELERIDVTSGFPGPGSTPEERIEVQQVRMVYLFGPDGAVPSPLPPDTPPPNPPPGSP